MSNPHETRDDDKEQQGTYELISQKEHRLQTELAVAEVEEIFEGRPKEIDDHRVVVAFRAKPADKGHANATGKGLVDLGLVLELRVLGFDGFKLDGDLLAGDDVDPKVDVTWMMKQFSVLQ